MVFAANLILTMLACVGLYVLLMFAINGIRAAWTDVDETIRTGKTPVDRHFDTIHKD